MINVLNKIKYFITGVNFGTQVKKKKKYNVKFSECLIAFAA